MCLCLLGTFDPVVPRRSRCCPNVKDLNNPKKLLTSTCLFGIILAAPSGAEVAQSVEQWTENPCVGSSILPLGILRNNS